MKAKVLKLCSLLMALLVMTSLLAACGGGGDNPFLGAWDDDESEQSFIFNEDGTGVQASYSGAIEFTYTRDGDTATITNEEMGVSSEVTLEDGVLYADYSSFVKVDEAEYVPENQETGGSESVLNGSYTDAEGAITITFDGAGTFGYSNNEIGEAGSGTYTYDGETLVVTIFQDGEEVSHEGSVREEDYAVYISLWDDSNIYYAD
mgnify:CR=1 FL=1